MTVSSLYPSEVLHVRYKPVAHRLRRRAHYLLIDLGEAQSLAGRFRFFSYNRFNLVSWHERDHGDGSARPLRNQIEDHLRRAAIDPDGGSIRVLCMPRILGLVFNPLSIFFCYGRDGRLAAILYEVNNTFGQRHSYLFPVAGHAGELRHHCAKSFYVSPFMDMALDYAFRVRPPGETVSVDIEARQGTDIVLHATLAGDRRLQDVVGSGRSAAQVTLRHLDDGEARVAQQLARLLGDREPAGNLLALPCAFSMSWLGQNAKNST